MFENNTNEENYSGVTPENNDATEINSNNELSAMNQNTTVDFDGVIPTSTPSEIGFSNTKTSSGNKSSWLLAIVGCLLVIFIGFFVFYVNTMGNPKNVFTNIVNTMFTSVENILSSQFNFEESALIDGNVKFESNLDGVEALNKETYNYTFGYDLKNKKAELSAGVKVDNKERLTAALNIKDNNMYIYLNELFDKVIKVDEDMIKDTTGMTINEIFETIEENLSNEKTDDMLYIVKEMKKITNKGFKNAEYEKTSDVVDINGKEIKATKMTLEFNNKNNKLIFGLMIDEMLKNDKLLTKISELSGEEKKDLIDSLKEFKNDLELEGNDNSTQKCDMYEGCVDFEGYYPSVSIYTGGLFNKIIKVSTEENGEELFSYIDYKDTKIIESDEMKFVIEKDKLTGYDNGEEVITGKVNSLEVDNIDVTFKAIDEKIPFEFSIKYYNSENNVKFDFKINTNISIVFFESEVYYLKLNVSFDNKKISDKEYSNKININVDVDGTYVNVTNDAILYLGKDITTNKTDNTIIVSEIKVSELTETDLINIINKLDQYADVFVISAIKDIIAANSNPYTDNCSPGYNCINDDYYDDYYSAYSF